MMKMKRSGRAVMVGMGVIALMMGCGLAEEEEDLTSKCSAVVQKVIPCLKFASGKEDTPEKDCCDATKDMKETKPECLCYIILQTHKGSQEVKSLGIQEPKLLQLPSACHLQNATVSNCPKLLGLSPNSADAAIFTNSSKATPATTNSETRSPQSQNASYGSLVKPSTVTDVMLMALAIIVVAFPTQLLTVMAIV